MATMFSPALHRQRHQFVIDFVNLNKPKKVLDLGCSECRLLKTLKFHRDIELLAGLDINGAKVKKHMHKLAPVSTDYLQPSYDQLRIELYQGSVTQKDSRLRGFDLVTSIELIEHLSLADVELFSAVVFGYMTPVAVIVSTPNSEFNLLLPGVSGFRHIDHKFEWTRAEFRSWALKVCLDYGYEVEFTGVGQAPQEQQDSVGFCSQIGVFQRLGGRNGSNALLDDEAEDVFSYTLLYSVNYPSLRDNNMLRKVLVSEVLGSAANLMSRWLEEKTTGNGDGAVPLCQTEGGGEEFLSELCMEMEEQQTVFSLVCTRRYVSVPLAVLWSCCPKVSELSGSVGNLRHLLMGNPDIKLNQDSSAVLITHQEQDQEEEGVDSDVEESGYAEASHYSHNAEQEEEWEANV
ncbi:small RNA 2'-O-methyltransferase [Acanthochromis polyacanthus]|uniref:small RNA 2'-O-methyltransferase n=1 Tax=Acanthochromis polyacanthus TaxID=80966 RepID=UPI002234AD0B|nr:small RNA 2'-O-methyltransferase [Acanthochromis polyacanthus]